MTFTKKEIKEEQDHLRTRIELAHKHFENPIVYTNLVSVSRSGMTRHIDVYIVVDGVIERITWSVAKACGYSYDRKYESIKTCGAGMDMGYEIIHTLGMTLWPEGTAKPHSIRNGEPDTNGGYYLNHRWL